MAETVSSKPWSDFKESDYDDAQYKRACLISGSGKSDSKLPVREPDGTLNKGGLQAAYASLAGARGGVRLSPEDKSKAVSKLKSLYSQAGLEWKGDPGSSDNSERAYQMPYDMAQAERVGRRLWRKEVAPFRSVRVRGETLDFTREKAEAIKRNFERGAFDQVPFVLGHTDDPEAGRGEVKGFEVTGSGLDALLETDERGSEMIANNPRLGVSMRYLEDYSREADGTHFGPMVQHVAATFTPVMHGMKPWEPVELAADARYEDLSEEEWQAEPEEEEEQTQTGAELSDEDKAFVRALEQEVIQKMTEQATEEVDMASGTDSSFKQGDKVSFDRFGKAMSGTVQGVNTSGDAPVATVKLGDGSTVKVPVSTLKGGDEKNMSEAVASEEYRELAENNRRNEVELAELRATLKQSEVEKKAERAFAKGATKHQVETYLVPLWMAEAGQEALGSFDLSAPDGDLSIESKEGSVSLSALADALTKEFAGTVELGERGVTPQEDETKDLSLGDFNTRVADYMKEHGVQRREAIRIVGNQHVAQRSAQA